MLFSKEGNELLHGLLVERLRVLVATHRQIGKVKRTMFLCRYLEAEDLRQEIHEGLKVVERWNGTNGFIFFGNGGEVATNRLEDQEISVLSLQLLRKRAPGRLLTA